MGEPLDTDDEQAAAAEPTARSKRKVDLGGVLVVLVVLGFFLENAALFWYYQPWAHGVPERAGLAGPEAKPADAEEQEEAARRRGPRSLIPLSPFLVNLVGADGRRYAKATIALGFYDEDVTPEVEENAALLASSRQTVIEVLSSRQADELVTAEGKDRLRRELLERLNMLPFPADISHVFLTEFIVQF